MKRKHQSYSYEKRAAWGHSVFVYGEQARIEILEKNNVSGIEVDRCAQTYRDRLFKECLSACKPRRKKNNEEPSKFCVQLKFNI